MPSLAVGGQPARRQSLLESVVPVRVALVILAPGLGGVSRHVFDLADGLRARGHVPEIFCREDAVTVQRAARSRELRWRSLRAATRSAPRCGTCTFTILSTLVHSH